AVLGHYLAERHDLRGWRRRRRRVLQPGAKPDRTGLEATAQIGLPGAQFVGVSGSVLGTEARGPQSRVADKRGDVHTRTRTQLREEAGGLCPGRAREEAGAVGAVGGALREVDRAADVVNAPRTRRYDKRVGRLAAVTHDDRRHTLHEV